MNDGQTTNRQTAAGLRDTGGGFRVERGPDWLFVTLDPPSASRAVRAFLTAMPASSIIALRTPAPGDFNIVATATPPGYVSRS